MRLEGTVVSRFKRRRSGLRSIYSFIITWIIFATFFPLYEIWGLLLALGAGLGIAYLFGRASAKKDVNEQPAAVQKQEVREAPRKTTYQQMQEEARQKAQPVQKKSYGPEIDPIIEEGNKALAEMGRLYISIKDPEVRKKINEIMRITDKITQDAISDSSDIPQIKKFMNYYLPTTIKLLNAYDRMSAQGIEGENLDRSMKSINEMLDDAIEAYKKMLDSLFANQALDIETEIDVMNTMLAREGLTGEKDFVIQPEGQVAAGGQGGR
jgi:5-bromo-4-chloroindolyl phosphate hydrolysis protein